MIKTEITIGINVIKFLKQDVKGKFGEGGKLWKRRLNMEITQHTLNDETVQFIHSKLAIGDNCNNIKPHK